MAPLRERLDRSTKRPADGAGTPADGSNHNRNRRIVPIMATEEPSNHQGTTTRLSAKEVDSLADRLYSRGVSKLNNDQPSLQSDLVMASRVLRVLVREADKLADRCGDHTRLLKNLNIAVGD